MPHVMTASPDLDVPPQGATDALFVTLYAELHRLARRELNRRGSLSGFGVTTLLHEAYLSIAGKDGAVFVDHARFMGYAARVMRGLIIDDVRRRRCRRSGAGSSTSRRWTPITCGRLAGPARAHRHQRCARHACGDRSRRGRDHRIEVLLRLLVRGDCRDARASRSGPSSAAGKRAGSTCITPWLRTPACRSRPMRSLDAERWRALSAVPRRGARPRA